jgi:EAL domain-containing protein (putative c-di-GMP-specific phosphodiesterase class I)
VGERLTATVRTFDRPTSSDDNWPRRAVARLGGDEFATLVWHQPGRPDVEWAVERIMDIFTEPFSLSYGAVNAAASLGVATTTEAADAQELLRHADIAVYVAKDAGKGQWVRYESSLHTAVVDRLKLRSDMERAVVDGGFMLHYQPIVALDSGRTVGFEALVRWDHPTRGLLPPLDFIEIAEESGLIVPLGSWVLHEAVAAAVRWRLLRPEERIYVSVNVSARQFRAADFVEHVRDEVDRAGLPYNCLVLELTESILVQERAEVSERLDTLRSEGLRVAIDDFGTGFSSLSYLRQLSVDLLKVDKSFVDSITSSPDQHAVVTAIVQLARTLKLGVIAEGIETHDELELLVSMGCQYGQGYLLSRPLSYRDTLRWMVADNTPVGTTRDVA